MSAKKHASKNLTAAGGLLVAALVVTLTVMSVSRAYAIVGVANALLTSRFTAAGGVSAGVFIPVVNQPVHVAAATVTPNTLRGTAVGAVTRHIVAGFANTVSSAFVNSAGTAPATLAANGAVGTDIAYVSPGGVNTANTLEVGPSLNEFRVENDEAVATNTYITLIW